MFLLSLSMKNLFRHARRSLVTAVAITAGLAIYIGVNCLFMGIEQNSERNFVWYEAGAAQVMTESFYKDLDYLPLSDAIPRPEGIRSALAARGLRSTSRIRFMGELFNGDVSQQVVMAALDPSTDASVLRIRDSISQGRYLDGTPGKIMMGSLLAEDLGLGLGQTVTLRTRTRDGAFQTAELQVAGLIDSPNPYLNQGVGFVDLSFADSLLEMDGAVTDILVASDSWQDAARVTQEVQAALGPGSAGLVVKSWRDLGQDFISLVNTHVSIYNLLLFLVFIISAVGITNTMLTTVYERYREIGMMRALGMREASLRGSLLIEAGGIGLIGSAGGTVLGCGLSWFLVRWGIDYRALLGRMTMGYRINGVFQGAWDVPTIVSAFVFGTLSSVLVCLVFLLFSRVMRTPVTECLRHV